MTLQCVSCGGTYDDVLADGCQYFHVCPPLSFAELQAAVTDRRVVLGEKETVEEAYVARPYLRADARNENADPRPTHGRPSPIVAEGKGVRELPTPAPRTGPVVVRD